MRKYLDDKKTELSVVICNKCKKELFVENGIIKEGCFTTEAVFGYFSNKDGQIHSFDLCENCYDEMLSHFAIQAECREAKELV